MKLKDLTIGVALLGGLLGISAGVYFLPDLFGQPPADTTPSSPAQMDWNTLRPTIVEALKETLLNFNLVDATEVDVIANCVADKMIDHMNKKHCTIEEVQTTCLSGQDVQVWVIECLTAERGNCPEEELGICTTQGADGQTYTK